MKTDADYLKEAMKALPDGDLDRILAYAKATKDRDALAEGEATSDEEAAPEEEPMAEPTMAASEDAAKEGEEEPEKVAASDEPTEQVELDDVPAEDPVSLMADDATLAALASAVEELSGMDVAGALAVMQERADEFSALFSGAAPSGTSADAEQAALMSDVAQERIRALAEKVSKRDVEIQRLTASVLELTMAGRERKIDDAIKRGEILPDAKDKFMKLAESAPDMLEVFLTDAKGSPAVPTEQIVTSAPEARASEEDGAGLPKALVRKYEVSLSQIVRDKDERRKVAIDRARKFVTKYPDDPASTDSDVIREAPRA